MRKPIVLVPTDFGPWAANFRAGYAALGWDVVFGTATYEAESLEVDLVHLNWPEELSNWRVPTEHETSEIIAKLERWSQRTKILLTVNNLKPHTASEHPQWRQLYEACIARADLIHHFSQTSRDSLEQLYPVAQDKSHLVRLGFRYELAETEQRVDPRETRQKLGFADQDRVLLVFGHIRTWAEMKLLFDGFAKANIARKRLLFVARYSWSRSLQSLLRRAWFKLRMRQTRSIVIEQFVPEEEINRYFKSSDVVLTIRKDGLTSGIPSLAMSLGAIVVAPRVGSSPEILAGTHNPLYDPDDAGDLARAMETAIGLDRDEVGRQNVQMSANWKWVDILSDCLRALSLKPDSAIDQSRSHV